MVEPALREQAYRFQDAMQKNIYDKIFTVKMTGRTSSSSDFSEDNPPPRFQQPARSFISTMKLAAMDIILLCLYNIVLFAAAYVAFLKYDVR